MDEQQYRQQMDDWLVWDLDRQRAVMEPPKPKPSRPANPYAVMIFPLAVLWLIGLGIIGIVDDQTSASAMSAAAPIMLIFCGLISWAWVSCVRRSNQVAAAKTPPTGRLILMPGDTAPAGTRVWVPGYRTGPVPGSWQLYTWHPVIVGLNGAHYYENDGRWYTPATVETYRHQSWSGMQTAGWVAAGAVVAKHVHDAHVRHDARIFADELDKRRRH